MQSVCMFLIIEQKMEKNTLTSWTLLGLEDTPIPALSSTLNVVAPGITTSIFTWSSPNFVK